MPTPCAACPGGVVASGLDVADSAGTVDRGPHVVVTIQDSKGRAEPKCYQPQVCSWSTLPPTN